MLQLLVSIGSAAVIGYCLIRLLIPTEEDTTPALTAVTITAGLGLGLGITSLIFFSWCLLTGSSNRGHILFDIALAAVLLLWWRSKRNPAPRFRSPLWSVHKIVPLLFGAVILGTLGRFLHQTIREPDGMWDAWAIWNLRARFLFFGDSHWHNAFSPLLGQQAHLDYPLLIPTSVARSWNYLGINCIHAPALIAALFTLATAVVLFAVLYRIRTPLQALFAGTMLLLTPFFGFFGASQYADVPLAFFIVTTLAFGFLFDDARAQGQPARYGLLVIAGLLLGCALWTKNEGGLLMLCVGLTRLLHALLQRRGTAFVREFAYIVLGTLPFLLAEAAFKITFPASNDIIAGQQADITLARLTDLSRYGMIVRHWCSIYVNSNTWGLLNILLPLYPLVMGVRVPRTAALTVPFGTLVFIAAGYFLIYLITPADLSWHLATSMERLFVHLYPLLLFTLAVAVRAPEEVALVRFSNGQHASGTPATVPTAHRGTRTRAR